MTLSEPDSSLPILMASLEQYGLYSGYKLNVHKTQTLSYNFFPQENVRKIYNFKWKTNVMKYLGVNIPRNLIKPNLIKTQ